MATTQARTGRSSAKKTVARKGQADRRARQKASAAKPGSGPIPATRRQLQGLVLRTGVVLSPEQGRLLACDPKLEQRDVAHVISLRWEAGSFTRFDARFNVHTACVLPGAEPIVLVAAESGAYGLSGGRGGGNLFRETQPPPPAPRHGGIRAVAEIAGSGYAVGYQRNVFRLDRLAEPRQWICLDAGLPADFDIEAAHGFDPGEVYAVGCGGAIWQYDGASWIRRQVPSDAILQAVSCAADGTVYAGGKRGVLLRGRGDRWSRIEQQVTTEDVWDLEWFRDTLYVSTLLGVFRLEGDTLVEVDFGADEPETTYQLSAAPGVLWSIGSDDVMSFDGHAWTRVF